MQSKKFGSGGKTRADIQKVNKPKTDHGKMAFFKEGGDTMASKMNAGFMAMMAKKKGTGKMAGGGMPAALAKHAGKPASKAHAGLKAGGSASSRADGVATKGKTKGTMVGMKSGGKPC